MSKQIAKFAPVVAIVVSTLMLLAPAAKAQNLRLRFVSAGNATYSCDMTGKRPAESVRAEDRNASSCSCLRQIGIQRC